MSRPKNKKVIVAMSGGVDSSVAAVLLKEQGYQVEGIFMRLGIAGDNESEKSARAAAKKLKIKFRAVDLSKEFKKKIINYFISEYEKGRTPNPCVMCNKEIKFGILMDKVLNNKIDYIATGHYAKSQKSIKSVKSKVTYKLLKAKDKNKDQSYFLYNLDQKILKQCLFPLGDYTKDEVREIAKNETLKGKFRDRFQKESQEICFIRDKYYGDFLKKHLKLKTGDIVDANNNILGKHKGLPLYTIGQRRDVSIGGTGPYYVVGLNRRKNQLVVSNNKNDKNLFSKKLVAKKVNWISGRIPELPIKVKAKVRYRMNEQSAAINKIKNKYMIKFSNPQRAVMSGQSVVFYKGSEILGGGIIT
ncbi:tRNA 2-thiouridine(34) synthase MnmA [Candidatus Parcubacteria bacterium]|nr:tRNA 2-thiouridine(34) synthase MnmA [Candidatus Parcubacteria bacterium]